MSRQWAALGNVTVRRVDMFVWEAHLGRQLLKSWLLQQSMYRSDCNASNRHVRVLAQIQPQCLELLGYTHDCCSAVWFVAAVTRYATVQDPGTSRAGAGFRVPRANPYVDRSRSGIAPARQAHPQSTTTWTPQLQAAQDGVFPGHTDMVPERAYPVPSGRTALRSALEPVDLSTPPAPTEPAADTPEAAKTRANARRNLTRNANRKANASFAKEMKDSLASGRPTASTILAEQTDLKSAWHTAAKEVAYKLLDLRKESWKEYTIFDKAKVHKEFALEYTFDPPIDTTRIDKYLSGHLRTSRAVWKAHWKKYGPSNRPNKCPEEAWEKLTAWWPTGKCQEEAATMASRRARVEKTSKVGRSSLVDRMEVQVSNNLLSCAMECEMLRSVVGIVCIRGSRQIKCLVTALRKHTCSGHVNTAAAATDSADVHLLAAIPTRKSGLWTMKNQRQRCMCFTIRCSTRYHFACLVVGCVGDNARRH